MASTPSALSLTPPGARPLKILCLHGYCQNAQVFRRKTGALRKSIERSVSAVRRSLPPSTNGGATGVSREESFPLAELHYIDALHVLPDADPAPSPAYSTTPETSVTATTALDRTRRSWWRAEQSAEHGGFTYTGWDASLAMLRTELRTGAYDGVLGFSQGAIAASLLAADTDIQFVVLVCGARSRAANHAHVYDGQSPLSTPSLHVWRTGDKMVSPALSRRLCDAFDPRSRIAHVVDGGHAVPMDKASRNVVCSFLLDMFDQRQSSDDGSTRKRALL